jgi:hypothetical protein
VREQPEEHGYDEAKYAHQQVDHSQPTDHVPGKLYVSLSEAYVGKNTSRNQVDDVLHNVDIRQAEQRLLSQQQPHYPDQDDHHPHNPAYVLAIFRPPCRDGSST